MKEIAPAGRPLRDLALFAVVFASVWAGCVVFVWKLGWLPEAARPWFRTAFWCLAAVAWVGWRKPDRPLSWLGLTPVSAKAGIIAVIAFAAVICWNILRVQFVDPSLGRLPALSTSGYAWSLVGVLVEELIFRGVIQTRLAERLSALPAILLAAALFLAIHVPGWLLLAIPVNASVAVSVFLIGAVCGWLRYRSRSLWPAVSAHWANNLGALI